VARGLECCCGRGLIFMSGKMAAERRLSAKSDSTRRYWLESFPFRMDTLHSVLWDQAYGLFLGRADRDSPAFHSGLGCTQP
jgi:hypothetical protein